MRFFLQIHRSVFDPSFYGELAVMPRRRKVLYVVQLMLLASIVAGLSHTYYVLDAKRGIAVPLEDAFSGIEIADGVLAAQRPIPYAAPPRDVAIFFNRFFDVPFSFTPDSAPAVLVDTAYSPKKGDAFPRIVLAAREMKFYNSVSWVFVLPYARTFPEIRRFSFTVPFINNYLHRKVPSLTMYFFLLEGVQCGFLMLFSICILALAPFIFRIDRSRTYFHFLSIAGFAATPMPVGFMLIAISGTSIPLGGDLLFLVSAVVMFRALKSMKTMASTQDPGER